MRCTRNKRLNVSEQGDWTDSRMPPNFTCKYGMRTVTDFTPIITITKAFDRLKVFYLSARKACQEIR